MARPAPCLHRAGLAQGLNGLMLPFEGEMGFELQPFTLGLAGLHTIQPRADIGQFGLYVGMYTGSLI